MKRACSDLVITSMACDACEAKPPARVEELSRRDRMGVLVLQYRLIRKYLHQRAYRRRGFDARNRLRREFEWWPLPPPPGRDLATMDLYARRYRYILLLICRQNYYPPYPEDDAICGLGRITWPWNSTAEREPEFDIIRAIAQPGADDVFWHMTRYLAD